MIALNTAIIAAENIAHVHSGHDPRNSAQLRELFIAEIRVGSPNTKIEAISVSIKVCKPRLFAI